MGFVKDVRLVAQGWRWFHPHLPPQSIGLPEAQQREFPTDWARTPLAVSARRAILGAGFLPLLDHQLTRAVEGHEALEGLQQPVIFVANHSSHLDAPLILTSLPPAWRDNTASGAASDYFFDVWWRAAATSLAFNAFPIDRAGARRSAGVGKRLLRQGWNLLIFPEGTRSRDGLMGEFKQGAAALSVDHGVPVVPVAVRGTYQAMPKGRSWPLPGRRQVSIRFGSALVPSSSESVPQFTSRISNALRQTLEEDATTWWQALRMFEGPVAKGSSSAGQNGHQAVPGEEPFDGSEASWRRRWLSSRPIGKPAMKRVWRAGR